MEQIKFLILSIVGSMTPQEKFNFFVKLSEWCQTQATRIHERSNAVFVETIGE